LHKQIAQTKLTKFMQIEIPREINYYKTKVDWSATLQGLEPGESRSATLTKSQLQMFRMAAVRLRTIGQHYTFRNLFSDIYIITRAQ